MRKYHKPQVRAIVVKFAGDCHCCGATIEPGQLATYYPPGTIASQVKGVIAHIGGLEGNSARCAANIGAKRLSLGPKGRVYPPKAERDPGYVDPGELAADRWNETHS